MIVPATGVAFILYFAGYAEKRIPVATGANSRCPNYVRYAYEAFGYFVTESSEHFAEYVPWFIKSSRPDLIDRFEIPLDEYPKRCQEQLEQWNKQVVEFKSADKIEVVQSHEYAATIMNSVVNNNPAVIYGNVRNEHNQLQQGCAVEVPCLVDGSGIQPTAVTDIPPQLIALMRTNVNVQELTVQALLTERRDFIYHAAMLDPHTSSELDLDQIRNLIDELLAKHSTWLPKWLLGSRAA